MRYESMRRCAGTGVLLCLFFCSASCRALAQGQQEASSQQDKVSLAQEYYRRGQECLKNGDYVGANKAFKSAEALLPPRDFPTPARTNAAAQKAAVPAPAPAAAARPSDPTKDLLKAIAAHPKDADLYYNLAVEYIKAERYVDARGTLLKVVQLSPRDKDAYYNLGVLSENHFRDPRMAVFYYDRYLKLDPYAADNQQVRRWIQELTRTIQLQNEG